MTTHRLLSIDGTLHFPKGGSGEDYRPVEGVPSMLLKVYAAGDCDTVPWPLASEFSTPQQLRLRLAQALYDERETNAWWKTGDTIELPDGTPFDLDMVLSTESGEA